MRPSTVLLVEDNPLTRKLVVFTLENEGLAVIEASSAKAALDVFPSRPIALVLQDICLPDMDGFELVGHLRRMPGGADVPILAFSGMLSHTDEARVSAAGFDDLISKPVDPSRLVQIIRSYIPATQNQTPSAIGKGLRMLVVDDDPVQRKLVSFRMQKAGFEVVAAADGNEALALARQERPHVLLSDVLMPGLDGFGLCMALRNDPELNDVPVVLATNSYVEPTDRDLARKAGARDLVLRTPELREVMEALRVSLVSKPIAAPPAATAGEVEAEHMRRMMHQLERQVALNAGIKQRCTLLSAEMAVLRGISEALASNEDIDDALRHTLAACFDAGGISLGALYLKEGDGLRVLSFGFSQGWSEADLQNFFGERPFLDAAIHKAESTLIHAAGPSPEGRGLLTGARHLRAHCADSYQGVAFGALVMLSRNGELQHEDRVRFGEAVASQISQALAVAHAFREKEQLERVAREQAAVLRSILDSIAEAVVVADASGRLIHWNPAAGALVHGGPRDVDFDEWSTRFGLFEPDQVTHMATDRLPMVRAIRGESVDSMEVFFRPDPTAPGAWLSVTARPWRDDAERIRGGVVAFRDVTREKVAQRHLMVSDRLASVGMLAAGVAHEINNPLAAVVANLDLVQHELADPAAAVRDASSLREMVDDARLAADRVRQIVRDLKVFSRNDESNSGAVDVRGVLDSSLRMARNEVRHRARLVTQYAEVGPVHGTESRLGQVFLNLIVNAAQAIPEGSAEQNTIRIITRPDPSGRIAVEVIDTGSGIAPDALAQLFTPFFTTKVAGVGTGLGLAICHRIVSGFGGAIEVDSEVGRGTTFRVLLRPAGASTREPAPPRVASPVPKSTRRARVLVVDDEPMIGVVIKRALAQEHDVTTTTAAMDALALLRRGEAFDVILCDLMMPQMTGMDFYAELQHLDPAHAARVVFLTGGSFTQSAEAFFEGIPNQRVEKPFDAKQLRALIQARVQGRAR